MDTRLSSLSSRSSMRRYNNRRDAITTRMLGTNVPSRLRETALPIIVADNRSAKYVVGIGPALAVTLTD